MALKARINRDVAGMTAEPATDQGLLAGAKLYREHCVICHGLPVQPETPTAKGMYPPPPQLFHGHGVYGRPGDRDVLESDERNPPDRHARLRRFEQYGAVAGKPNAENADNLPEAAKTC